MDGFEKCSSAAESDMKKLLVLFAHPVFQTSLLNKSLLASLPKSTHITVHDLYECYPNFMIDVEREQALLNSHDVVMFQHPMYWYSSPAILKEWMDLVFEHGYAYGSNGTALRGKSFISAVTTGGDSSNFRGEANMRELLRPFELTAKLCNMTYLPPLVTSGGLRLKAQVQVDLGNNQQLQQKIKTYQRLIDDLLHDRITGDASQQYSTMNELLQSTLVNQND